MNQPETTWSGGSCPACGEAMPTGVVRCRYCQAPLILDPTTTAVSAEIEDIALAGGLNIDDFMSAPHSTVVAKNPEKRKKQGKGLAASVKAAPHRPQPTPQTPRYEVGENQLKDQIAQPTEAAMAPSTKVSRWDAYAESSAWLWMLWGSALLLLAPLCVSGPVPGDPSRLSIFVSPIVHSGNEPHNLILINSVVRDGDIDVLNNYADVHQGGNQAGRKFAGWALDHHVNWYWHSRLIRWWEGYEMEASRWKKDSEGHPIPTLKAGSNLRPVDAHEYSQHSPGLAWVLAPVVWPFRKTSLLEPVTLLCSGLATIAGLWAFFCLLRPSGISTRDAVLITVVTFLGTPLWHYGRTLYLEPYLMACAVLGYAMCLRFDRFVIAGIFLGIGTLIEIPFAVIAAPLIVSYLIEQRTQQAITLAVPVLIAIILRLLCNQRAFGGWFNFPQKWEWGYPLLGLGGLAFSWNHGLLMVAPVVAISLVLGVPRWFKQQQREAVVIGSAAALYILLMASWLHWSGGSCYSARLIVPVVPFLMLPIGWLIASPFWKANGRLRALTWSLAAISVVFGMVGAFSCEHVWNKHPTQILLQG